MADTTAAPRGRGSGRARGRGRGGPAKQVRGGQAPPLAAQLKQLDRLQEPDEMAVLRRYRDLGATQIQSTYGLSGLLDRRVQIPSVHAARVARGVDPGGVVFVSLLQADQALQLLRAEEERERALARREVRLPEGRRRLSWGQLTPDERRVLLLSQKEFNSFRARQGTGNAAQQAQAPQAPPQGEPGAGSSHAAEDGGDDASDEEDEN